MCTHGSNARTISLATKEGTSQGEREGHSTAIWSVHERRPISCNETCARRRTDAGKEQNKNDCGGRTLPLDFHWYVEGFEVGLGTEIEAEITLGIVVGFQTGDGGN